MGNLSYPHYDGLTVAFLSPVWTRLPAAARAGVAAAVLAVAFVALIVGTRVRQVRAVEPVDTLWFVAHPWTASRERRSAPL